MQIRLLAIIAFLIAPLSAYAQLTTVDGGLAVEDSSGLMFSTAIGSNLTWLPGTGTTTISSWVAGLNAEDYGGYSDWTVATGVGTAAPNTTTNQLGELFQTDCGNVSGGALQCASFSSLNTIFQNGDGNHNHGYALFYSSSLSSATCCDISTTSWWAYTVTPTSSGQTPWNYDTSFVGRLGRADAIAVRQVHPAPEIDPSLFATASIMLMGSLMIVIDRRRQ
jgi:hypothetical protein